MAATSVCSCCVQQNRDIFNVSTLNHRSKLKVLNYHFKDLPIEYICRNCWRKMENFELFRLLVISNIKNKKHTLTPDQSRPAKRLMTTTPRRKVIDQIIDSVEKMKLVSESTLQTSNIENAVAEEHHYLENAMADEHHYSATPCNRLSNVGMTKTKKALFDSNHHSYAEKTIRVMKVVDTCDQHKTNMTDMITEITKAITVLSSNNTSVLSTKNIQSLCEEKLFSDAALELSLNIPLLYDLLTALVGETGNKTATVAMIYSMLLNSRNRKNSAIQKLMTVLAINCHADNKLLTRMNKLNITMSAASKPNILDSMSAKCEEKIIETIAKGNDGKINGDNLDIYVHTNDTRMNNRSHDYHFFASDWTPLRITNEDFKTNQWIKEHLTHRKTDRSLDLKLFSPDVDLFQRDIKVLVARKLVKNMPHFNWMKLVIPDHIFHELQEIVSRPTYSHCMPIILKNEMKYEECIEIMDKYEDQFSDWYRKAGRADDFDNINIPVGGDQLTRVRLDGAKSLRMGAHEVKERFDNLYPVVIEMFHTQMDFLEKTVKKFMKEGTGRDIGTLRHLQILIQRSSVNGNVKSRFHAHDEFVEFCGDAYILEAAMEYFGMAELSSPPTLHQPSRNISGVHRQKRTAEFDEIMTGFVGTIQGPLNFDENTVNILVDGQTVSAPLVAGNVCLNIQHEGRTAAVHIPVHTLNKASVKVPVFSSVLEVKSVHEHDDLKNYIKNFLQYYFILLNFKDAISEGDIFRTSNMLKFMIPMFYKHSNLSKYMVECIDFILKTELILPPKLALQVRVSSFVNPKGRIGKNKAADMQKENQVKDLKDLIKGLGANKTENLIIKMSRANVVMTQLVANLDRELNCKEIATTHKPRDQQDDLNCVLVQLRSLRPFQYHQERVLKGYAGILPSVFLELNKCRNELGETVIQIADRLTRGTTVNRVNNSLSDVDHEEVIE